MGIEENKRIMQRYFDELMNKRDYSKVDEILHADYVGSGGGGIKGVEGHKKYTAYMHSVFSDLHWETLEMIAEGEKIALFQKLSGVHEKEYGGFPGTGKRFSINLMVSVYEFKNGKVCRGLTRQVYDYLNLYQQLDILPPTEKLVKEYKESHNLA